MNQYAIKKALDSHGIKYYFDEKAHLFLCYVYAFSDEYDIIYYDSKKLAFVIENVNGEKNLCTKENLFLWLGY